MKQQMLSEDYECAVTTLLGLFPELLVCYAEQYFNSEGNIMETAENVKMQIENTAHDVNRAQRKKIAALQKEFDTIVSDIKPYEKEETVRCL